MENKNKNNNHWKVSVAEFRGYMRAKLENIESTAKEQKKELTIVKGDIVTIKEFIAGRKAVQNFRSTIWGFIGGIFTLLVGAILYKIFG